MIRALTVLYLALFASVGWAENLKLAVTTSLNNSGLSDVLLPVIERDTGINVQLLIVGTGQALRLGEAGDVDAILVHSKPAETAFIAAGHGTHRREIMYNDFVVIGPQNDPAGVAQAVDAKDALMRIAQTQHDFVSRGDNSGTHIKELSIWTDAARNLDDFGPWYKSVGSGMGASLNTAAGLGAYILSDRASWLNFSNKAGLSLLFSGDPALFNQYAFIPVNPARHPHVNGPAVKRLESWLVSDTARDLINGYKLAGETLFSFNADQN